jgi:hypothetical protein
MSRSNRFEYVKNAAGSLFQIPFVQFDEDTCDTALTALVVQGFTEGWVDEVGNVVYRPPQWDAPISWTLHTDGLKDWDLPSSDVAMATYVEVYPGALPALPSGTAQAMLAGRAPIPSDYVTGLQESGFTGVAAPEFIIDTDSTGKVTAQGAKNWYYQKQKKYGLRPYQITSPLLADRQQAQAQAEGLLRFMLRYDKSGTFDIPGEPNVRLGQTILLHGRLEDQSIYRTYYVEATSHEYVEGDHYTTTLTLTHGRDPGDPSWQQMVLPNFSAAALAQASGILSPAPAATKPGGASYILPAGGNGTYVNPLQFAKGLHPERIDQGVDYSMQSGSRIVAIGDSGVVGTLPDWYSTYPLFVFQLLNGPYAGKYWYLAEAVSFTVQVGSTVKAGQTIATSPGGGFIEIGWARTDGAISGSCTLAGQYGGWIDDGLHYTTAGVSFNNLLQATDCPSGVPQAILMGSALPAGYP